MWAGVTNTARSLQQYKNNVFQFNVLNHNGHNIKMNFPHSSNKLMTLKKMRFFYFSIKPFALLVLSLIKPWTTHSRDHTIMSFSQCIKNICRTNIDYHAVRNDSPWSWATAGKETLWVSWTHHQSLFLGHLWQIMHHQPKLQDRITGPHINVIRAYYMYHRLPE